MSKPFIDVAAGLILKPDGSLLLGQRPADKPWPGWWELPGGKIEAGETVMQALTRELKEELDINVTQATPWVTYVHEYPKKIVRLAFCQVTSWEGTPTGLEGQSLAWVDPNGPFEVGPLLPATEPPLRWLKLPTRYLVTSIGHPDKLEFFLERLKLALQNGVLLVQFREPEWAKSKHADTVKAGFEQVLAACRHAGAQCLLNSAHPQAWWHQADGVHVRATDLAHFNCTILAPQQLCGASVHNADELQQAQRIDTDFVMIGHVSNTPSHPDEVGIGWQRFTDLARQAGRPVFAIGGQSAATEHTAKQHGAHGVAAMRGLLPARQA